MPFSADAVHLDLHIVQQPYSSLLATDYWRQSLKVAMPTQVLDAAASRLEMPPAVLSGRRLLLGVFTALLFFVLFALGTLALHGQLPSRLSLLLRLGVWLALMYAVWIGENWARLLMGGVLALSAIYGFATLVQYFQGFGALSVLTDAVSSEMLLCAPAVRAFQAFQRTHYEQ